MVCVNLRLAAAGWMNAASQGRLRMGMSRADLGMRGKARIICSMETVSAFLLFDFSIMVLCLLLSDVSQEADGVLGGTASGAMV